jgi:hypothetical protein
MRVSEFRSSSVLVSNLRFGVIVVAEWEEDRDSLSRIREDYSLVIYRVKSLILLARKTVETSSWRVDLMAASFIIKSSVAVNFSIAS